MAPVLDAGAREQNPDEMGRIRILHVDDDPDFVNLAATLLQDEHDAFTVTTETDPRKTLERIEAAEADIHCVVCDYDMPHMDGLDVLDAVRERHPDLPFVLFTGKGSEEIASEAISAGVTDYLQKEGGTEQFAVLANRIENAVARYRTERELDATRRQYRKLVEQNFVGIYIIQDGEFVYVNPRLAEIHGYDREEIVGMSPLELVAPDERDRVQENLRRRLDGEVEDIHYQTVGLRKDGERIEIELHGSYIEYQGRPAVIGAELDVSDREERERRFEAVFNNTYQFMGLLEPDGTLVNANDRALEFGGVDRDAVLDKPLWETYWFRATDEARAAARAAVETAQEGEHFRTELQVRGADGETTIDFSVNPVTDTDGQVTLLVAEGHVFSDDAT